MSVSCVFCRVFRCMSYITVGRQIDAFSLQFVRQNTPFFCRSSSQGFSSSDQVNRRPPSSTWSTRQIKACQFSPKEMNMNVFAKGNALVAKGSSSDAVYLNNCLEEIFKQLSVNRQHIDLFYALYIKLLDRLFGEDVSRSIDMSANPTWVKGVTGGWLRALMAVSAGTASSSFDILSQRPHSIGRGTNACYIDSLPHPISSILHKFVPQSPMFDLLSKIQGGFEIKVALLPTKLQMFIAEHPVYAAMDAHSQPFVGFALLKTPLNAPNQRSHIAHKSALLLDAVEFFLICMLRYPTTSHTLLAPHSTVPEFMSSSAQNSGRFNPLDTLHNRGPGAWMRGLPYLALLNEYFKLYLPVDGSNRSSTNDSYRNNNKGAAGDSANTPLASSSAGATSSRNLVEQTALEAQHAQLFVHLAVAYWVDCALVLRREHGQLGLWRRLLTNVSSGLTDINAAAGMHLGERPHPSPVEVVLVDSASLRWTVASMQCTYLLVMRVLADPQLLERISLLSDRPDLQPFAAAALNRRTPAQSGARSSAGLFGNTNNSLLEGPQSHWQVLQRPLYEMLRTIFNHGESASVDPQVVALATEVWLLYLQPWTARTICNGNTGVLPTRSSNLGVYSSEWKPFVAANLHFYTTLFACYLRLVSQRSLSVSEQEGYHHLSMLERVLQVFTPALVSVLDELTRAFKSQYVSLKHIHSSRPGQSLHSVQSRGLRPNLSNSSLNSSTNNTNSNITSNVFQTPGFVNYRRAPMTEGYNSAGAEGEDEGEGDSEVNASNVTPELLRLVKFQHEFLYPDRRIDDLPDCGITDFRNYAAEASINVVATLHQMNENLSAAQDSVSRIVNQAMADLRTLLGLPPYQGPRNRYSERLLNCIAAVVALVPSASAGINTRSNNNSNSHNGGAGASGSVNREGTSESGVFRDPYSGRLTEHGRAQILRGQAKCAVQDLLQPRALSVDPLECPLCSYEWAALASGLIVLSKVLNAALSLPADSTHIMCSWETILCRAWANRPPRDLLYPLRVARSAVRINLRFLASTRTLSVLFAFLMFVLYKNAVVTASVFFMSLFGVAIWGTCFE